MNINLRLACTALVVLLSASGVCAHPKLHSLMPELKDLPRPSWVKPGAHIFWWVTDSTKIRGKRGEQGSARLGHSELTIVAVEGKNVALEIRTYAAAGGKENEAPSIAGGVGDVIPGSGGEYWVHPQALKILMKKKPTEGVTVARVQRTVAGNVMNVVAISMKDISWQFDETSGVLVAMMSVTPEVEIRKTGRRTSTTVQFRALQQVNYPWMSATLPAWTQKVKVYDYDGTVTSRGLGSEEPFVQPIAVKHTRTDGGATWFATRSTITLPTKQAQEPAPTAQVTGVARFGLCLPPRELAKLQVGTVLSENRFAQSKVRVIFVGVRNGKRIAVLREDAPNFMVEWHYDLQSGVLVESQMENRVSRQTFRIVLKQAK